MKEKEYKRLPGTGRKIYGTFSLWLGKDHLLHIERRGYSEYYKRFYFRDIQALILKKTDRMMVWNFIFGIFLFIFGLIFVIQLISGPGIASTIILLLLLGLFTLLLVINCYRGSTCECYLKTAVQTENLLSLNRVKRYHHVLKILEPLILDAQNDIEINVKEEVSIESENIQTEKIVPLKKPPEIKKTVQKPKIYYNGRFHVILSISLLVDAGWSCLDIFYNSIIFPVASPFINLFIIIAGVGSLVKQHRYEFDKGLKKYTWWTMGYIWINIFVGSIIISFYITFNGMSAGGNYQFEFMKSFSELSPLDSPFLLSFYFFFILCSTLLGVIWIMLLRNYRIRYKTPPPLEISKTESSVTQE